MSSVPFREIE
ncbi:hypothetical protein JL09_g6706, partial [Pichia kudriavzevii]